MADFYAARRGIIPPLPWPTFSPTFSSFDVTGDLLPQQQRVVIAMALACEPDLLIMDEPTTGLDVTTEAVILDLIRELRERTKSAILFISHNIAVVANVCDRVGVLYAGELVEEGPCRKIIREPRHPYTVGLISAMPSGARKGTRLNAIEGSLPDLKVIPDACIFVDRCTIAEGRCRSAKPPPVSVGAAHISRCFRTEEAARCVAAQAADTPQAASGPDRTILQVTGLTHIYNARSRFAIFRRQPPVRAVHDVSLDVKAGRTLAIVGESGSGKSTLARCLVGLTPPTEGLITLGGERLQPKSSQRSVDFQRRIQFIFQNPTGALNPRFTVEETIARPLRLYRRAAQGTLRDRVVELMRSVNLSDRLLKRYPHELSGGEKQRVSIARVLGTEPDLIICDEPTSALDISVQAAVLNELVDLQARLNISYLFISHDLGVVRHIADRVAIMYLGAIVEIGPTEDIFRPPHHPYTESLLSALPTLADSSGRPAIRLASTPPVPGAVQRGCPFASRCPRKVGPICEERIPPVRRMADGRSLSCHIPIEELADLQRI